MGIMRELCCVESWSRIPVEMFPHCSLRIPESGCGVAMTSLGHCWNNGESVFSALLMIPSHITAGTGSGASFPVTLFLLK